MWNKLIVGVLLASIAACSSGPERKAPPMEQRLHTSIFENGSKMFVFQMLRPAGGPQGRNGGPPPGGGPGGKPGKPPGAKSGMNPAKMLQQAHEALAAQLAATGYCREGYMTLEEKSERGQLAIRGECTETATAEDRQTFGEGQLPRWY